MAAAPDKDLLDQARRGDHAAFTVLYQYYTPPLYRYLAAATRSEIAADDLTAEVWLIVWGYLHKFRGPLLPSTFRAWLFRIGHNEMVDWHRRRGRVVFVPVDTIIGSPDEPNGHNLYDELGDLVETRVEAGQLLRLLARAGQAGCRITPAQRDVILLRIYAGLTSPEAGRVLDRTPEAVRRLQQRGLAALTLEAEAAGLLPTRRTAPSDHANIGL